MASLPDDHSEPTRCRCARSGRALAALLVTQLFASACAAPQQGWQRPTYVAMASTDVGMLTAIPFTLMCALSAREQGPARHDHCGRWMLLGFLAGAAGAAAELTLAEEDEPSTLDWIAVSTPLVMVTGYVLYSLIRGDEKPSSAPPPPPIPSDPRVARFRDEEAAVTFMRAIADSDNCAITAERLAEILASAREEKVSVKVEVPPPTGDLARAPRCTPAEQPDGSVVVPFALIR